MTFRHALLHPFFGTGFAGAQATYCFAWESFRGLRKTLTKRKEIQMKTRTNLRLQEETARCFSPTILLAQSLENCSLGRSGDSAKRLMTAVLNQALEDFEENVFTKQPSGRSLYRQARDWIFDETEELLFSFKSICRHLGFDPDYLRCQLLRASARKLRIS